MKRKSSIHTRNVYMQELKCHFCKNPDFIFTLEMSYIVCII